MRRRQDRTTATDEIKVTVAAQACLLPLNLHHDYYGRLSSIIVRPESFDYEQEERADTGFVTVTNLPVSGLSSSSGAVVLSWPDTIRGAKNTGDGMISAYGATKPAEFFAVVTELFFEKPVELQREHPALYEEFRQYYRQDPAARERDRLG